MKIVILDGHVINPGDLSWDCLKEFGDLTVYERTPFDDDITIIKRIADANVVFTCKTPITAKIVKMCPEIKFIGIINIKPPA